MLNMNLLAAAAIVGSTHAAIQSLYGQCGGIGYNGPTTCTAGSVCSTQNSYYAQCTPGAGAPPPASTAPAKSTTTARAPPSSTAPPASGATLKATFTEYGSYDNNGSPNCNTETSACGFYDLPGYNAALSQQYFGVGPGAGAGPACGLCYRLTPETDSSGNALKGANSIVVKVNNLCPADGNPLCAQTASNPTNQYGAQADFDLCQNDGAAAALFGTSGVELAIGTAVQVSCSEYSGTQIGPS